MNKALFDRIQQRLKQKEIKYTAREGIISLNMEIDNVVGKLSFFIDVRENDYITYAVMGNKAAPENITAIAEYLHRANYGLVYGNFEIDHEDGEIRYKLVTDCEDASNISNRLIDRCIVVPCMMFEIYGNGMIKLMLGVGEPEKLIDEAEANIEG